MASVYKQKKYKPIPDNAEIVRRRDHKIARWIDGRGNRQEATLSDDGIQIIVDSGPYWARFRDADGIERRKSTGCRDKQAAQQILQDWLNEADQIRSKIITPSQIDAKQHAQARIKLHREEYLEHLKNMTKRGRRTSPEHVANVRRCLTRITDDCRFSRLVDIRKDRVQAWMSRQEDEGKMSGRTVNTYRSAIVTFCRWAVREGRLLSNPLDLLGTADESETKRNRRPLTAAEMGKLLAVVRCRPLVDAMTVRKGPRRGQLTAKVKPSVRDRLDRLGHERYLIDLVMVYTGLRRSEVERQKVSDLHLNSPIPYIELRRSTTKNARNDSMPLRKDLAPLLAEWIANKLPDAPLFHVPGNYVLSLNNDLIAAGIPKKDSEGRTFDVHCFRHHFATQLELAGASDRMIKRLLRHSDGSVTGGYLHAELKEKAEPIEKLPDYLTLSQSETAIATGTDEVIGKIGFVTDSKSMPKSMTGYAEKYAKSQSLPDIACHEQNLGSDAESFVSSETEGVCQSLATNDIKAGGGNRTRMASLEGWGFTIKLHPRRP